MDEDQIVLAGYDDMGAYEDMGADELGRRRRRGGGGAAPTRGIASSRRAALRAYQSDNNGLPLDQVCPFPNGTFTSTVTTLSLVAQPQRDFQPRRLVIDQIRIGATSTGLIQVTQFTVGADPQFVQTGSIPASMFSPTAVGIMLKPAALRPGLTLTLALSLTGALTAPDTIVMSAAAVGPAIG